MAAAALLSASSACVTGLAAPQKVAGVASSRAAVRLSGLSPLRLRTSCRSSKLVVKAAVAESQDETAQNVAARTLAGSLFALLANTGSAAAAQEVMQLADVDSRPLILLVVLVPAVGWVLFNILKPALNQLNKMRGVKSLVAAAGLGAAASLLAVPEADAAQEIAQIAVDSRPLILLVVLLPAIGWVLFNILKPALNQLNKMRGLK